MPYNNAHAELSARWIRNNIPDETTRRVCLAAVSAIGKLRWDGNVRPFTELLPCHQLNTRGIGCVCYAAPIAFALMGFALSIHEVTRFYKSGRDANDGVLHGVDAIYREQIYGRFLNNIVQKRPGVAIPPGAMVYHGRPHAPTMHVTMSIGKDDVVSCWAPGPAKTMIDEGSGQDSEALGIFRQQKLEMEQKGLWADTVVLPATAFTGTNPDFPLAHTDRPFWDLW